MMNITGVIYTTNYRTGSMHLPPDDRRHYVVWSERGKEDFDEGYWDRMWAWYEAEGFGHVAAYLRARDISRFDPEAPPVKTDAFWQIVGANRTQEESELVDVIDELGNPDALTVEDITDKASQVRAGYTMAGLVCWLSERKNSYLIPHRFESCHYIRVDNPQSKDHQWRIGDRRQNIYARAELPIEERFEAAKRRQAQGNHTQTKQPQTKRQPAASPRQPIRG